MTKIMGRASRARRKVNYSTKSYVLAYVAHCCLGAVVFVALGWALIGGDSVKWAIAEIIACVAFVGVIRPFLHSTNADEIAQYCNLEK